MSISNSFLVDGEAIHEEKYVSFCWLLVCLFLFVLLSRLIFTINIYNMD